MKIIKLLSWHEDIETKAATLKGRGRQIDATPLVRNSAAVSELARLNPDALVLDLDRLPSHSREIALAIHSSRSARHIPVLFAGGLPGKIKRIRAENPGARYASWSQAARAITALLEDPRPRQPSSRIATSQPRLC